MEIYDYITCAGASRPTKTGVGPRNYLCGPRMIIVYERLIGQPLAYTVGRDSGHFG